MKSRTGLVFSIFALVSLAACGQEPAEPKSNVESTALQEQVATTEAEPSSASVEQLAAEAREPQGPGRFLLNAEEQGLPPVLAPVNQPWTGDFDGMTERRIVRVLTVFQTGGYFLDGPKEKGMTYDLVKMFEKFLNERLGTGHVKLHVILVPVAFDQLLEGLVQGYGDIAAAGLSITPARRVLVDFSAPLSKEVNEVLVTGPAAPGVDTLRDLAGEKVYVRPGSSYRESLEKLNDQFVADGLVPVDIQDAPRLLQDEDLLEMVSAGLLPMIALDDYKARFWAEILEGLTVREDIVIESGRRIAWAFRKDSPLLAAEVNEFARTHRQGTLMGNILIKRYLKNTQWVDNALEGDRMDRFNATIDIFRKYADQYEFDHLMLTALGYQESKLDQSARSQAGAIGIMQLLSSTATDPNVGIAEIERLEPNIHAGTKYLDFLRNRYFNEPGVDEFNRALFSFAAYNAGPARIRGLRREAAQAGLDPNRWFNNVELVAAKEIGRETVQYVSNIYKYYLAYRLITNQGLLPNQHR